MALARAAEASEIVEAASLDDDGTAADRKPALFRNRRK